jgi:hypothetical protein
VSLAGQASMATPPRGTSRAELADRVEASIRAAASRKDRRQWQQMVTAEVGNAARYTTILGEYAKKFADADRAKHFQQVVKEEDFWDGLRRWDEASQRLNPQNAAQFLNLAKSLLEDPVILKFPTLTPIRERLPYFEAVAKRPSDRREPESIKTLLENPLITGLNTIDVRRNVVQRYYVHREPVRPTKGRVDFHYVKNFQLEEEHFKGGLNTYLIDEDQIVLRDGDLTAKSPQWALADKLREAVERWPKDGWEAAFCSALEKAVADPELDPILKVLLLKNFIEAGKEGSLVFEEATRPVLGMLNRSDFDPNANWLLPDNDASNQQREIAKKIVAGLPPIAGTRNEMNKKLAWLAGFSFSQHAWIGWLAKEDGEDTNQPAWRCLMPKRVRETGDLVVIFQPAGEIIRLETIGRLSNQEPIVMAETSPALVEGRPVFLVLEGK